MPSHHEQNRNQEAEQLVDELLARFLLARIEDVDHERRRSRFESYRQAAVELIAAGLETDAVLFY